jgi:hypothetical protein
MVSKLSVACVEGLYLMQTAQRSSQSLLEETPPTICSSPMRIEKKWKESLQQ